MHLIEIEPTCTFYRAPCVITNSIEVHMVRAYIYSYLESKNVNASPL
jgi:hypothetical protein